MNARLNKPGIAAGALCAFLAAPALASAQTSVTINPAQVGPALTNQILGANMGDWEPILTPGYPVWLQSAGIAATRWPGGSNSDLYHWATNSNCGGAYVDPNATFDNFMTHVANSANLDVAVTLDYGTNAACNGGGDPNEAAAWVAYAKAKNYKVSHWTIGNEVYGAWETDLHAVPNDPTTYASSVANGYYPAIKAADPTAQVGVVVAPCAQPPEPYCYTTSWDTAVLSQSPFDFVEFHWYAQGAGYENDSWLLYQTPLNLRADLALLKSELNAVGHPNTPIMLGELGSVNSIPGKQSTSITQALFAGEVLGELMNAGVSRATWWTGFGSCYDASSGANFSSSLYGWQNFGGYMLVSDGTPEFGCANATKTAPGTLLPTAETFKLISLVARNGETMLGSTISGSTDLRAYAMTNNGGRAVVLINLNQSNSLKVAVNVMGVKSSAGVTVSSYDRAAYDKSRNNVWTPATTKSLGSQRLPLSLTLTPWSINVVRIK